MWKITSVNPCLKRRFCLSSVTWQILCLKFILAVSLWWETWIYSLTWLYVSHSPKTIQLLSHRVSHAENAGILTHTQAPPTSPATQRVVHSVTSARLEWLLSALFVRNSASASDLTPRRHHVELPNSDFWGEENHEPCWWFHVDFVQKLECERLIRFEDLERF